MLCQSGQHKASKSSKEKNNFDIQNEMGTQDIRGKFNEQLWVNF